MSPKHTKRNHYLPQLYLRSFLIDAVFWVYYKDKDEPIAQTPINTGVEKNIYNIKKADGTVDDSLEKVLGITENNVKPILDKLTKSRAILDKSDINKLAEFFSFFATRVPRNIEAGREVLKESVILQLKKFLKIDMRLSEDSISLETLKKKLL